jgi:hypothetical protein
MSVAAKLFLCRQAHAIITVIHWDKSASIKFATAIAPEVFDFELNRTGVQLMHFKSIAIF